MPEGGARSQTLEAREPILARTSHSPRTNLGSSCCSRGVWTRLEVNKMSEKHNVLRHHALYRTGLQCTEDIAAETVLLRENLQYAPDGQQRLIGCQPGGRHSDGFHTSDRNHRWYPMMLRHRCSQLHYAQSNAGGFSITCTLLYISRQQLHYRLSEQLLQLAYILFLRRLRVLVGRRCQFRAVAAA